MKLLFDFFPLILFFVAFKAFGIYPATAVVIASSILQVAVFWLKNRRFERMHLISLAMVVVLGSLTLLLRDERFIKWKPTVVNWAFAVAFIGSHFVSGPTLIQRMMGHAVVLPAPIWTRLSMAWALFFVSLGCVNLYVAFSFPLEVWVNFKVFGLFGLTVLFIVGQGVYLSRHMQRPDKADNA